MLQRSDLQANMFLLKDPGCASVPASGGRLWHISMACSFTVQGWRLDPLLLLCQLFTTTVAFSYAFEALRSRQELPPPQVGCNCCELSDLADVDRIWLSTPAYHRPAGLHFVSWY